MASARTVDVGVDTLDSDAPIVTPQSVSLHLHSTERNMTLRGSLFIVRSPDDTSDSLEEQRFGSLLGQMIKALGV